MEPNGESGAPAIAGSGGRRWENLNRDLLVSIFRRVGPADLIAGVPFACSSWRDAAMDPSCWKDLDFRDWNSISVRLHLGDGGFRGLLGLAVARAGGALQSVRFPPGASEDDLLFVAERCPRLLYFSLQSVQITMDKFCSAISKLKFLKGMGVHETFVSYEVLQHVNECCMNFAELKVFAEIVDEDMAIIICKCLPDLHKLEIPDCYMSRQAILTFLDGLKDLEYLDISGYEKSGITGVVLEKASRLKVFQWESKFDHGEPMYCSGCHENCFHNDTHDCAIDHMITEWLAINS